jgi:hypothetical protein
MRVGPLVARSLTIWAAWAAANQQYPQTPSSVATIARIRHAAGGRLGPHPSDRRIHCGALCSKAGTDLFPDAFIAPIPFPFREFEDPRTKPLGRYSPGPCASRMTIPCENGRPRAPDRSRHRALKKPCHLPVKVTAGLASSQVGRSAPDDDQVGASKGDPLPFGQVAPAEDVPPVGVDGDLDRLG